MGKLDEKRSSSILGVFSGLRGKPKEGKRAEKAEETPSIARRRNKDYGSLGSEPTRYRYGEPAPSYEYAQAEAYAEAAEQEKRDLNNRIENVDGADFQNHFRQLQVSGQETIPASDKMSRVDVREVAAQDPSKRSENSSKDGPTISLQARYETEQQRKQESEAEGQKLYRSENFDKSEFTEGTETALMDPSLNIPNRRVGQECAPEIPTVPVHPGEKKPITVEDGSLSLLDKRIREWDFKIHKALPPCKDPFSEVEAAQLGFVQYLFNKATAEIGKGDVEAANPCIERLQSIHGAKNVIGALEDEIYGRVIEDGVSKLAQGDKDSALQILDSIKDPRFLKYQRILQLEIMEYVRRVAGRNIFSSNYKEAFQAISDLREHERIWDVGPNYFPSQRLIQLAAYHIRGAADRYIRAGEFVKAVSLLDFLQETPDYKWSICIDLSRKFLQMADDSVGREELELVWSWLSRVDKTLELASSSPKSIPANTDLVQMVFNCPYDSWALRIAIINCRWDLASKPKLDRDIVESRNYILCRARQIYEKRVYLGLDEQNLWNAYQNLLNLEVFWHPQKIDQKSNGQTNGQTNGQEVKVPPTSDQRILKLFLSSRQRSFKIDRCHAGKGTRVYEEENMTEINLPTDSSLGFVYCLTNAEIFYFEKRNLENALVWCQKAIEIADENVPHWASKSDALYLLARIFTRKNMPLDADYHYSLIPSFEKYDQWRIYGEPGRLLREIVGSAKLDHGKLNLEFEDVMLIVNRITRDLATTAAAQEESDKARLQARYLEDIIRALYADDISWSTNKNLRFELLPLEGSGARQKVPAASQRLVFYGPFLHLLSLAGPWEYLRIALHNPWVDVEERDNDNNTPIHQAAIAFDKEKISLLLDRGANPGAVNTGGNSPLHLMLSFPKFKVRSADIDVKGALNLFVRAPVECQRPDGSKFLAFLLLSPNNSGETPIELMRKALIQDLREPKAATEIGYLVPFKEAWDLISKLAHCPQTYLDDSMFDRPAMRERELKTALKRARVKEVRRLTAEQPAEYRLIEPKTLAQSQSRSRSRSRSRSPHRRTPSKPPPRPREPVRASKPKRFGIF
ncbi:hypothetical protein TWF730_000234 [Orbilia blumenaviensis]|uniref:Uncharacterized protein n=1 Tax=Orbilia blumenaviensis TaxID=1796055 RepID=A0AAV9VKX7_9PEZI